MSDIEALTENEFRDIRSIVEALGNGPWDEADVHARHGAALDKALRIIDAQAKRIVELEARLGLAQPEQHR